MPSPAPIPAPETPLTEGARPAAIPQLSDTEARFIELFEHAGDLILIVDPAGRVLFANRAWRESLGYDAEKTRGLTVFDVTHRADHAVCQSWLGQSEDPAGKAALKLVFLAQNGREVPVQGFTSARMEGGRVVLLRGFFRDLTHERRTETALRESAELLHLLIDRAPLGVFRTDAAGRLTYTSEHWRRMAGLVHVAQPRGVWWQVVHVGDRERVVADWEAAQRLGHEFTAEFRLHPGSPAERWVRARASLNGGFQGGGIGFLEDITEHRLAALALRRAHNELEERVRARTAELEAANHELAQFAYVVSHDLRAPLRGVSLLSEWIAQDYAPRLGPEGVELFGKIRHRVQEMHALIEGVLAYARIGHAAEDEVEVNLNRVIDEVIQSLAAPPEVRFEVPPDLPVVRGLPQQLSQVFQNLLDNAVKFVGRADGRITILARREEAGWEFAVRDNGPGIAPRHHARIFQIFQRLNPDPKTPGTGIGLSLVKRIVETRGGRMGVESDEGAGATFRFTWPDERRLPEPTA